MVQKLIENRDVVDMTPGEQDLYYNLSVPDIEAQLVFLGLEPRIRRPNNSEQINSNIYGYIFIFYLFN